MDQIPRDKIRTMKGDLEELMTKRNAPLAADRIAEKLDQGAPSPYAHTESTRSKLKIILAVIFIVLPILGGVGYVYIQKTFPSVMPSQTLTVPRPFVTTEKTEEMRIAEGARGALLDTLREKRAKSIASLVYLPYIIISKDAEGRELTRIATPKEFFDTLRISPPVDFFTAITEKWNIYGYRGHLVFVFEIRNMRSMWGTLLTEWEKRLQKDFVQFFPATPDEGAHAFEDTIIKNDDARVVHLSATSDLVVGYTTVLGTYLIMSTSENALRDIHDTFVAGPITN